MLRAAGHDDADDVESRGQERLESALSNLRKQHMWGDISDDVSLMDPVKVTRGGCRGGSLARV